MHVFNRTRITNPNSVAQAKAFAVEIGQMASTITGRPITPFQNMFGGTPGAIAWSTPLADLADLGDHEAKLSADPGYQKKLADGAGLWIGNAEDRLIQLVSNGLTSSTHLLYGSLMAVARTDKFADAVVFGVQMQEYLQNAGFPGCFGVSSFSAYGEVGWLTGFDSLADVDRLGAFVMSDEGYASRAKAAADLLSLIIGATFHGCRTGEFCYTFVLQKQQLKSGHLERALATNDIDEANCAKRYWQLYFPSIGYTGSRRERKEENTPNQMLNYGYAVLASLCHRALIIYGLSPLLGVKHTTRYQAHPLVYDIMEAFRPSVDLMIAEFLLQPDISMNAWSKKVGTELRETRVKYKDYSLKLMDAIDASACSLARSYAEHSSEPFWVPSL